MPAMQPVQSSNIAAVSHDPFTNTLRVQFRSGKTFDYPDTNQDEFRAMMNAQSIGSHFANVIKPTKEGVEVQL
jgi:KTSC domain